MGWISDDAYYCPYEMDTLHLTNALRQAERRSLWWAAREAQLREVLHWRMQQCQPCVQTRPPAKTKRRKR